MANTFLKLGFDFIVVIRLDGRIWLPHFSLELLHSYRKLVSYLGTARTCLYVTTLAFMLGLSSNIVRSHA